MQSLVINIQALDNGAKAMATWISVYENGIVYLIRYGVGFAGRNNIYIFTISMVSFGRPPKRSLSLWVEKKFKLHDQ